MPTLTPTARTLVETIKNYDANDDREELERFQAMKTLKEAVRAAAGCRREDGKVYPHQRRNWRFWPDSMRQAAMTYAARSEEFRACKSFNDILALVGKIAVEMNRDGLGELYCYDVAFRIGAKLNLFPTRVYLHAGTRKGAERLLGRRLRNVESLDLSEFNAYPNLQQWEPWQVENILCGYAKRSRSAVA